MRPKSSAKSVQQTRAESGSDTFSGKTPAELLQGVTQACCRDSCNVAVFQPGMCRKTLARCLASPPVVSTCHCRNMCCPCVLQSDARAKRPSTKRQSAPARADGPSDSPYASILGVDVADESYSPMVRMMLVS